ncbi:hypothetical protein F4802DRAFT_221683 [Xylaria palmicola]|nr:hypothetical protein F4802DRAFT_221683 [Xylaria palmicola]
MCLINGEILDNSDDSPKPVASLMASKFLEERLFRAFRAPKNETRRLTFNKSCRLTDMKLTLDGILTRGHIWKLGRIIDTSTFTPPRSNNPHGRRTLNQRMRPLRWLVFCLRKHRYLSNRIKEYLKSDAKADPRKRYVSFTETYHHRMATELVTAIREGQNLRLGSIWDPSEQHSKRYRAVFVWPSKERPLPAYVFTSTWPADPGSEAHDANDTDHHVSLAVSVEAPPAGRALALPHLRVRGWLLGMCFFEGCPRTEVVFPWPRALQAVKP